MQQATISLPSLPPSANNMYVNVPGRGRVPSRDYMAWRKDMGWRVTLQKPPRFLGDVDVRYSFGPRNRSADVANREKATSDLLVACGVIKDDRFIYSLFITWSDKPGVEITITAREPMLFDEKARAA